MKVRLGHLRDSPKYWECTCESWKLGESRVAILKPLLVLSKWLWPSIRLSVLEWQEDKVERVHASALPPSSLSPYAGGVEHMECEIKLEGPVSPDVEPGKEETEESKKRKRKPYRPGEALGWVGAWGGGGSPGSQQLLSLSSASS